MKNYFEKHLKQKLKTQPQAQHPNLIDSVHQRQEHAQQFVWTKPNKNTSFFKSKHVAKMITQINLIHHNKNLPKPNNSLHIKPNNSIDEVKQLSRPQSMQQSDESLSSQNLRQRGFSLEYLKMTKKHRVKSLLEPNLLKNHRKTQSKAWLDSPFDKIEIPSGQANSTKQQKSTRKVLTPLSGQFSKEKDTKAYQTEYNHSKSGQHLTLFKKKNRKANTFFKKFALAQEILSSNPPRSPYLQQNITPISFIPIQSIRLQNTRYGFSHPKIYKTQREGSNKTYLKKSKYSPFKSRNGSSASNNEGLPMGQTHVKRFSGENQHQLRSTTSINEMKNFQIKKHKRLKSHLHLLNQSPQNDPNSAKQIDQNLSIINSNHTSKIIAQGLYGNIKLLNQIKECFEVQFSSKQKQEKNPLTKIPQLIKIYVFGEKDVTQNQKKYVNHLFPHMDQLFEKDQEKSMIKQIICAQRLLMICIVDLLGQEKLSQLFEEVKLTLMILLVIYLKIFRLAQINQIEIPFNSQQNAYINSFLTNSKLKSRHPIQKHLKQQLLPYVDNLFRHSREMYQNLMKKEIQDSRNRTINRTFYEILKKYAIYLTNNEQKTLKKYHNELICNFSTCPAPYILIKPQKRYTLCIDLDQTILFSNFSCAKRFQTAYRPGAKEFIIQLSKYFEIIVFTSSVKEYADAVIKPFVQFVDHALYRYHVTRGKNLSSTVKDLSRIGRRLQKVIFIDDLECNIKLQPENSIKVTPWKGDPKDTEIINLKKLLVVLGKEEQEHDDVRKVVSQIRQKMKSHQKSRVKSPELK